MTIEIELLVVPDCPNEADAVELITTAVADARVLATVTRTLIATPEHARQRGFVGSSTILLNGADPFAQPDAVVAKTCRLYPTPDGARSIPTLRDLRQALKRVAANWTSPATVRSPRAAAKRTLRGSECEMRGSPVVAATRFRRPALDTAG